MTERPVDNRRLMRDTGVQFFLTRAASIGDPFYQEWPPPPDLAAFVACTWARLVRCTTGAISDPILPDGCADIMVYEDQPPRVAGPDSVTRRAVVWDGLVIVGIRLRPGACRAVLRCPAAGIINDTVLLSDLIPGAEKLHHMLLSTASLHARLVALEQWVRSALERATWQDRAVIAACRLLGAGSKIDVGDAASRLDWNARTMHRQFVAACGYGPKHLQRIMRIQETLRLANKHPNEQLAELAAAAGYADQAHMTRDFRDITGFTPRACLAQISPGWGAWIEDS
jgi:AraC-like DNA-binding protein